MSRNKKNKNNNGSIWSPPQGKAVKYQWEMRGSNSWSSTEDKNADSYLASHVVANQANKLQQMEW